MKHTSNRSSSHRYICSSNCVFLDVTNVESSDQEGNDTQMSFRTCKFRTVCQTLFIKFLKSELSFFTLKKQILAYILYEPQHEKTCLCHMQITKAQISLHISAIWSVFVVRCLDSIITSFYIWNFKPLSSSCQKLSRQVWVYRGRKPRRQVFSWSGSYHIQNNF